MEDEEDWFRPGFISKVLDLQLSASPLAITQTSIRLLQRKLSSSKMQHLRSLITMLTQQTRAKSGKSDNWSSSNLKIDESLEDLVLAIERTRVLIDTHQDERKTIDFVTDRNQYLLKKIKGVVCTVDSILDEIAVNGIQNQGLRLFTYFLTGGLSRIHDSIQELIVIEKAIEEELMEEVIEIAPRIDVKTPAKVKREGKNIEWKKKQPVVIYHVEDCTLSSKQNLNLNGPFGNLPYHLQRCALYCLLFPVNYEFEKDTLVQLWMAQELIVLDQSKRVEDTGSEYFDALLSKNFFQFSCLDHSCGEWRYKINATEYNPEKGFSSVEYLRVDDYHKLVYVSEKILHISLLCEDIDSNTFELFERFTSLHSLLLLREYGSCIQEICPSLFLKLMFLRVLDLSCTQITELPSSVGNLKNLRYLDISKTSIRRLPNSLCNLSNLQTLKLRGCLGLFGLPKDIKNLINLRHLDIDVLRQLSSMPLGIGNLTNLQTLNAFLIGRESGCRIGELKDMRDLHGTLHVLRLENVSCLEEAKEADLSHKLYLNKLELRWSEPRDERVEEEEQVLEGLQPHTNIKELQIASFGGVKFPTWIEDSSFSKLETISLNNCRNCQILPSLGQLIFLESLYIGDMDTVNYIDHQFCGEGTNNGFSAFPKLETLVLDCMPNLEKWIGIKAGDFPCLHKLNIAYCPKLVTIPMLSCLNSLKHLEINRCPKLSSLPEEGLPAGLEFLYIRDCPIVKERCCKEGGKDWLKIAHIATIWIDCQKICLS